MLPLTSTRNTMSATPLVFGRSCTGGAAASIGMLAGGAGSAGTSAAGASDGAAVAAASAGIPGVGSVGIAASVEEGVPGVPGAGRSECSMSLMRLFLLA